MMPSGRAIVTCRVSSSEADTIAQIVLNGRPMIFRQLQYLGLCALLLGLGFAWTARAATTFEFATAEQGRAIIAARDEYVQRLSPLERALKAKSGVPVSEEDFLQFLTGAVQPWPDADRAAVQAALESIRPKLAELSLPLPNTVLFVRITGAVEGNSPHTRANAILLTEGSVQRPGFLPYLIAHELFHIASRYNKAWRDAMYATIGFVPIEEVTLPLHLASRKITNPDAPRIDAAIKVQIDGGMVWVAPLLQSTVDRYDATQGGEFHKFLKLTWLEVARGEHPPGRAELTQPPRLRDTAHLGGFLEQIGRNTKYIIHPEEILADNFAQLATGQTGPSPEVHQRLREALQRQASIRRR
jgi:hypothetical protein